MSKYSVLHDSATSHCCFDSSVVETDSFVPLPPPYTEGGARGYYENVICECFDSDEAERICELLNESEEG